MQKWLQSSIQYFVILLIKDRQKVFLASYKVHKENFIYLQGLEWCTIKFLCEKFEWNRKKLTLKG